MKRNQRSSCEHLLDHRESKGIPEKNICLCFTDYSKTFDCVDHKKKNCGKLLKRWEYQTIFSSHWETCMWVKKQLLEPCMERLIGSRLKMEYNRVVCCYPVCHETCWAGWITSQNQDGPNKHQQTQICRWYHSNGRKQRGNKEPLNEGEGGKWKSQLKTKY